MFRFRRGDRCSPPFVLRLPKFARTTESDEVFWDTDLHQPDLQIRPKKHARCGAADEPPLYPGNRTCLDPDETVATRPMMAFLGFRYENPMKIAIHRFQFRSRRRCVPGHTRHTSPSTTRKRACSGSPVFLPAFPAHCVFRIHPPPRQVVDR